MKLKGMIIGGIALVLLISAAGFLFYKINTADDGASVARVQQPESEKEDNRKDGKSSSEVNQATDHEAQPTSDQTEENSDNTIHEETDAVSENSTLPSQASSETGNAPASQPADTQSGGLYFATREEAIAFGFSRFTQEEIDIYNRAAAKGLTPEQQEIAIQMAYSRFTAEEIAAIEEALNR